MRDIARALRTAPAAAALLVLALAGRGARPPAPRTDRRQPAALPIFVTAESDIPRVRARVGGLDVDLLVDSSVAMRVVRTGSRSTLAAAR